MSAPNQLSCDQCDAILPVMLAVYKGDRDGRELYECTIECPLCGERKLMVFGVPTING